MNLKSSMLMVCYIHSNCLLQVLKLVVSLFITDTFKCAITSIINTTLKKDINCKLTEK